MMSLDELRKRLESLNRGPIDGMIRSAADLPSSAPRDGAKPARELESLVPGRVRRTGGDPYYAVISGISQDSSQKRRVAHSLAETLDQRGGDEIDAHLHATLAEATAAGIRQLLFVDLETCGFAGTPVFLIGTMYYHRGDFRVEQLLARTYAEESAIVARLARLLTRYSHLVTFNGKSFDWPFVADRAAISRVTMPPPSGHCDLLHAARRRFKEVLPDCKLQTLEQHICGRRRFGDIPGSEIPAAYHDFVRTGDARRLRDILRHNFLDLTTMAELLDALLRA